MVDVEKTASNIFTWIERNGLLLKQDSGPSVVSLLVGGAIDGSWWAHPRAKDIFDVLQVLAHHPDILITKLIARKDTLVHRNLWSTILAVGIAREEWQLQRLPRLAAEMLLSIDQGGGLLASGKHATELQRRLLVHGEQAMTTTGRHGVWLESWTLWAEREGCQPSGTSTSGKRLLEQAVRATYGEPLRLPWE
jgi:hypothetical protein